MDTESRRSMEEQKPWIVLQNMSAQGQPSQFLQHGPFSTAEVREKLYQGQMSFSDFLWRKGFDNWMAVTDVKDFAADKVQSAFPRTDQLKALANETYAQITSQNIEQSILKKESIARAKEEMIPLEADSIDLAEPSTAFIPKWHTPSLNIIETKKEIDESKDEESFTPVALDEANHAVSKAFQDLSPSSPRFQLLMRLTVSALAAICAMSGAYFIWQGLNGSGSSIGSSGIHQQTPSAPANTQTQKNVWPTGSGAASRGNLDITPINVDKENGQLLLQSAAEPGDELELWIEGRPGQILNLVNYHGYQRVKVTSRGVMTPFDLSQLKLSPGVYEFYLRHRQQSIKKEIFVGERNQQFTQAMAKHRARLVLQSQSEKNELQAVSANLLHEFQDLQSLALSAGNDAELWKQKYADWQGRWDGLIQLSPLNNWQPSLKAQMIYGDMWQKLLTISQQLRTEGSQLNSRVLNPSAAATTTDNLKKLQELQVQASALAPPESLKLSR